MTWSIASLFAGAGGLDLGFEQSGAFEVLWANDFDADAVRTYNANFRHQAVLGDIRKIEASDIPDVDIVLGGFPCQGFSLANTGRREDDSRNELYLEMLRIVAAKRPRAFVAENVKGLKLMSGGEVLRRIVADFVDLGYDVNWKLMNAADYGVPQRRERVFIVGTRRDIGATFAFPAATHARVPHDGLLPWVTAGGALGDLPDPDQPHGLKNHTYSKYKLRFNGYLGHRAIDPDMPAPTVTARGDNRGGVVVLHHPSNERRMSVRELATIQSFPVDFFFDCTQSAAYRLIGNAVAPRMGLQVALALREALQEVEQREIADDSREWQRPEPSPVPQIQVAVGNSPAH